MQDWIPLSWRSAAQLRERAEEFRWMAATANGVPVATALLRLADRFEPLAIGRERAEPE
jgi:hypothetical protein